MLAKREGRSLSQQIERLIERGHAYEAAGNVYFDVRSFPGYGRLSGNTLEALEAGAAIVSTDCPFGPREVLDRGRFGRLVPVGDAEGFSAAIEAELDAPDIGPDARRAERADWMQRYEPEVITARYLSLIQEVIQEAQAKRNDP